MRSLFILLSFLYISPLTIKSNIGNAVGDPIQQEKFPIPPESSSRLFYVQRTPNTNTIIYELNNKDGQLDQENPVHVFWIKYGDKGQKEELNYIQRKFAYGLTSKPLGNERYDIRFVSYKKFPLTLMKGGDGKYHIFATVQQRQMILEYVFLKIEGGSFWLPNVVDVELKGSDPSTGREIIEHFKP